MEVLKISSSVDLLGRIINQFSKINILKKHYEKLFIKFKLSLLE